MKLNIVVRPSKKGKDGESPLELSIIINGNRKIITLERRCIASKFNTKTQRVRGDKSLNEYIDTVINKCWSIHNDMINEGITVTLQSFLDVYRNGLKKNTITLFDVWDEVMKCKDSVTVYRKYCVTKQYLKDFFGDKEVLIQSITPNTCNAFFQYLCTKVCNNTAIQKIKQLNSVMLYAKDEGYIASNPCKVKMKKDEIDYQPLTSEQLHKLKTKRITNTRLNNVRWLFLFQCHTGLAYTDLATLTMNDIKDNTIIKRRKKTKVQSVIPILNTTQQILEMYDYKLPILSNQKYNAYLKELGDICGITQELHSHLARHTFATICINNGIDINVIAKMLGHSSTRITLTTYAHLMHDTVTSHKDKLNKIF